MLTKWKQYRYDTIDYQATKVEKTSQISNKIPRLLHSMLRLLREKQYNTNNFYEE